APRSARRSPTALPRRCVRRAGARTPRPSSRCRCRAASRPQHGTAPRARPRSSIVWRPSVRSRKVNRLLSALPRRAKAPKRTCRPRTCRWRRGGVSQRHPKPTDGTDMSRPIVVFDLDGTLIDTAPDLLDSLNHCLEHAGLACAAPKELRRFVGLGGRVMIERAFAAQQQELTGERLDALQAVFLDHYGANMPGRSQPFPGVIEALDRLAAAGYIQAVCTNKYERLSTALIGSLDLTARFAAICGADTFA